ncbi:MAG TPA: zf-HC2 domain-containing protein [Gemmatimonadales bacterium]|nr:zf-HC2 domain-containing protein [Gemmatimonadales bacterium]
MSHVDEGTLHAYLDGELSSAERAPVDGHLAQCGACRAALAEERALLERATALLGSARPRERPAPPLEQLRREITPTQRSPWRLRPSLAWAASIALAVGLGYYLHTPAVAPSNPADTGRMSRDVAQGAPAPDATRPDKPVAAAAPAHHELRDRRETQQLARHTPAAADSLTRDTLIRKDSVPTGVVALEPQVTLRNVTPAPTSASGAAVAAPPPAARIEELDVRSGARAAAAAPRQRSAVVPRDLVATTWSVISRGTAASLLGEKPVGLPGLATREIRRSPGPDTTIVVEQSLDAGTVIRIYQRPVTPSYSSFDSSAANVLTDRLARYVGRLRVEISGPISKDSLNRLLEQVEPLP